MAAIDKEEDGGRLQFQTVFNKLYELLREGPVRREANEYWWTGTITVAAKAAEVTRVHRL